MCCGYGYSRILLKVQEKSKHIVCKIFFYSTDKKIETNLNINATTCVRSKNLVIPKNFITCAKTPMTTSPSDWVLAMLTSEYFVL